MIADTSRAASRLGVVTLALLVIGAAAPVRVSAPLVGSVSALDVAVLIACLMGAAVASVRRRVDLGDPRVLMLLTLPLLTAALSAAWSLVPGQTARAIALLALALGCYGAAADLATRLSTTAVRSAVGAFVVVALGVSALFYLGVPGFGLYTPPGTTLDIDRLISASARLSHPFIGLSNDLAPLLGAAALLLLSWARSARGRDALWYGATGVAASVGVIATLSRGVGAAFAVAVLLLMLRGAVAARWLLVLLVAVAAGGVLLAGALQADLSIQVADRAVSVRALFDDRVRSAVTVSARSTSFDETLALAADAPWTGYGAGVLDPRGEGTLAEATHNTVLQQLLFAGVPLGGLAALAWLVLPLVIWFGLRRVQGPAQHARDTAVVMAGFLVLASLTQTFMEATTPRVIVHLLLGIAVGDAWRTARTEQRT